MMLEHPFSPERRVGTVYKVDGTTVEVSFSDATKLPKSHYGEQIGRGEVGEFLVVDVGGKGAFGRVALVEAPSGHADVLGQGDQERRFVAQGRLQLLSTVRLDGSSGRGVEKYPKVGDPVYAASGEIIKLVLESGGANSAGSLHLGHLSVDESVSVEVPLERLFGRHLAVVGATGSGKSWTLALLAEGVAAIGGKMILIDATGEFHTLGSLARHIAFSSDDGEPAGTTIVGIPHYRMRESDRNAFLNPSSGAQLPKLREAVRSLRLAHAVTADPNADPTHKLLVGGDGLIAKTGRPIAAFQSASAKYAKEMNGPASVFDIRLLGDQLIHECIYPPNAGSGNFGNPNANELGYVSTLVSRISDLLQTAEVMRVIDPDGVGTASAIKEIAEWLKDQSSPILRISLRNLTYENHLREIVVNILGQALLGAARRHMFRDRPLVVAIDEAHQFFDVTVGDEFASSRLSAFDSIAKEGRKYGLTTCVVTQRPSDLPSGVLSQVGMTVVHRIADGRDRQKVEQAAAELDHSATRLLPGLVAGEAILMGVDFPIPVSVRIKRPAHPPESEGPRYVNWVPADGASP